MINYTSRTAALSAVFALLASIGAHAQSGKPDFSGRWHFDAAQSAGPQSPREEVIEHDEPRLVITSVSGDGSQYAVRLSTDGIENLNIVGGREMTAVSTWDGDHLVTTVRDAQGMQFTEVRSLSDGGDTLTTEGFMGADRARPMFKRVGKKQ